MSSKRSASQLADPTLPRSPITIDGKTYDLCFKLRALGEAELAINTELQRARRDDRVNLLYALPGDNLLNLQILFAAALRVFHPEIPFDDAINMVTYDNIYEVRRVVREAWEQSAPPATEGVQPDPPQPGE